MSGGRRARGYEGTEEEWTAFVRENAIELVRARDEKIRRLRERVTKLEHSVRDLREQLRRKE